MTCDVACAAGVARPRLALERGDVPPSAAPGKKKVVGEPGAHSFAQKKVDAVHDGRGPILVHCSAGIGRTGTFCCVHTIVQKLDKACLCACVRALTRPCSRPQDYNERPNETPTFNVFETILKLRASRAGEGALLLPSAACSFPSAGMVQTKDQFEFCYRAVLEEYKSRVKQMAQALEQ